jgi:hypothetical protein
LSKQRRKFTLLPSWNILNIKVRIWQWIFPFARSRYSFPSKRVCSINTGFWLSGSVCMNTFSFCNPYRTWNPYRITFFRKVLKLYAWETSFEEKIASIRNGELLKKRKRHILDSITHLMHTASDYLVIQCFLPPSLG